MTGLDEIKEIIERNNKEQFRMHVNILYQEMHCKLNCLYEAIYREEMTINERGYERVEKLENDLHAFSRKIKILIEEMYDFIEDFL